MKKGISLITLIITIVVVIILAAVVILTLGNNNPIDKAKEARGISDVANIKEKIQMDILGKQLENAGDISDATLQEILENYGTLSEEENLMDKTLTTTKEKYEIKVSDIFNGTTVKEEPKNPTFTTVANAPDISGFNKANTYYVAYNLNEEKTTYIEDERKVLESIAPSNWYDYTAGVNHWANIKTTGGGNDCYWVWIPRYAYCITEGYHSNSAGTIEVKFLQGTTNKPIDGSDITISNSSGSGNWNVHPAFWFDKNNNGIEDAGEQLSGIWVAKFEASSNSSDVVENPSPEQLVTNGGGNTTDLQVRVKPNVTSWREINVNNIFTVCQNLITSGNSLENTNNLDSHMIKNTEWGAVAYLSRSIYGKNGEVWNNPYYNNTTNNSPITGLCGKATNAKDLSTKSLNDTCKYNEVGGGNASTTGNVYGVYDMAGGAWEYVAGIYTGVTSDSNRSKLWELKNSKYVDKYTNTIGSRSTYYGNTTKYGDAVYETSNSGEGLYESWDSTHAYFLLPSGNSGGPVFGRGGRAYLGSSAGIFAFGSDIGNAYTHLSFRPCLINLD